MVVRQQNPLSPLRVEVEHIVVIVSVVQPYFLPAAFVIFCGYQYFAAFYRASALEMKRLDAVRSPHLLAQLHLARN